VHALRKSLLAYGANAKEIDAPFTHPLCDLQKDILDADWIESRSSDEIQIAAYWFVHEALFLHQAGVRVFWGPTARRKNFLDGLQPSWSMDSLWSGIWFLFGLDTENGIGPRGKDYQLRSHNASDDSKESRSIVTDW
jgi:hypothetical protein